MSILFSRSVWNHIRVVSLTDVSRKTMPVVRDRAKWQSITYRYWCVKTWLLMTHNAVKELFYKQNFMECWCITDGIYHLHLSTQSKLIRSHDFLFSMILRSYISNYCHSLLGVIEVKLFSINLFITSTFCSDSIIIFNHSLVSVFANTWTVLFIL